jgi:hypothetical protein
LPTIEGGVATITGYFATSHAYAFLEPDVWDARRERSRANYQRIYGKMPAARPEMAAESPADNQARYAAIRRGHDLVRTRLAELKPDVVVLIGDDQDENYTEANLPQFSVFVGDQFVAADRGTGRQLPFRGEPALARFVLNDMVEAGFDLASSSSFEGGKGGKQEGRLGSHAHTEPLLHLVGSQDVAVLPVFVNAIHVPAPTPARCLAFGRALREAIQRYPGDVRVALGASGGLSHFTAGYPYRHYEGPLSFGAISVDFDRRLIEVIRSGDFSALSRLSNHDLLVNGDIEFRQWVVMLGALGRGVPEYLAYEPFFSGLTGMGVGFWSAAQ